MLSELILDEKTTNDNARSACNILQF